MFYRPSTRYAVEAIQHFRPNIVGFHMEMGERRWYINGCYLTPDDTSTIESVVAALKDLPLGAEMLVTVYININLEDTEGYQREEEIVAVLMTSGLEDMLAHFLPQQRPWCQDSRTWSMVQVGRYVRSRMYYILGKDRRLFRYVSIWYPRHKSDHYLVLGCLCSILLREHTKYLGRPPPSPRPPL